MASSVLHLCRFRVCFFPGHDFNNGICCWNACIRARCRLREALISNLRDARGLDERSVQRKPVPMFWQVVQSRVLHADSSKAITEHEQSEDRDHRDMAVQDAVPRFE